MEKESLTKGFEICYTLSVILIFSKEKAYEKNHVYGCRQYRIPQKRFG
jgi:hypothetical protein